MSYFRVLINGYFIVIINGLNIFRIIINDFCFALHVFPCIPALMNMFFSWGFAETPYPEYQ